MAVDVPKRMMLREGEGLALPLYGAVILLIAVPLLFLIYASFRTGSPVAPGTTFTTDKVVDVFTRADYRRVIINTLKLATLVTVISVTAGTMLAWLIARTDIPGVRFLEVVIPIPLFLSPFAGAVAWVMLGSKNAGFINVLWRNLFGTESGLINIMSFPGLVWTMSLFFIPYAYLFTLSPLRSMDGRLEEASRIGGASLSYTVRKITLPMILPGIAAAILMIFVLSAEMFSIPGLIGSAIGYHTLPYFIYRSVHLAPSDWSGAAAAGLFLLLVMAGGIYLQRRATRVSQRFVTVSGKGTRPTMIKLGRARWFAFAFAALYIFFALVLPWGALVFSSFLSYITVNLSADLLTLEHWRVVLTQSRFNSALRNSLTVGTVGPMVAIFLALAATFIWQRTDARFRNSMETVATLPVAVPGIVFGVGILWAAIRTPLYGTVALLVLAYSARYLPHPVRIFSSTMVQLDRGLDEAARVGGASLFRTMRTISAPLLKPAILSAWLLLFIMMIRELNVAIMVVTRDSIVLPVLMWGEIESGSYQRAAIVGMVESAIILAAFLVARYVLRVDLTSHRA